MALVDVHWGVSPHGGLLYYTIQPLGAIKFPFFAFYFMQFYLVKIVFVAPYHTLILPWMQASGLRVFLLVLILSETGTLYVSSV